MKISLRSLYGCLILVGGVSYRITKVRRQRKPRLGNSLLLYSGEIECFHREAQFVWILRKGRQRYLVLNHTWLQHGHRGVIHAFAEISRFGTGSGSNRWLRVGHDFPDIPSSVHAARVRIPWQKRRPTEPKRDLASDCPLAPLLTEELLLSDAEVQS